MITCTKKFGEYPFAHRQHNHKGHCAQIHGHNWTFELTFKSEVGDTNGFVLDFGGGVMRRIKSYLEQHFDHTLVLNDADPFRDTLVHELQSTLGAAVIYFVPDASCEGLARFLFRLVNNIIGSDTDCAERSVQCTTVTVFEDNKNSATYTV